MNGPMPENLSPDIPSRVDLDTHIHHVERGPVLMSNQKSNQFVCRVLRLGVRIADSRHVANLFVTVGSHPFQFHVIHCQSPLMNLVQFNQLPLSSSKGWTLFGVHPSADSRARSLRPRRPHYR